MNTQKIFVLDTDPEMAEGIIDKIENLGLEGLAITSMEQAIEMVQTITPDLIIMDLGFAQEEGIYFLSCIKEALPQGEKMPAVSVLNGANDHFLTTYAYDLGASDVHAHSFNNDSLRAMMMDMMPMEEE